MLIRTDLDPVANFQRPVQNDAISDDAIGADTAGQCPRRRSCRSVVAAHVAGVATRADVLHRRSGGLSRGHESGCTGGRAAVSVRAASHGCVLAFGTCGRNRFRRCARRSLSALSGGQPQQRRGRAANIRLAVAFQPIVVSRHRGRCAKRYGAPGRCLGDRCRRDCLAVALARCKQGG